MRINELIQQEIGSVEEDESKKNRWLLTYADVITLLLGFFALIVAISEVNPAKVEIINDSTSKSFGTRGYEKKVQIVSLDELVKQVNRIIKEEKLQSQVEVGVTNRGVVISGKGATFFNSGNAEVLKQAHPLLKKLSGQMKNTPYNIAIEGHTDNIPIKGAYPSNWELSSARASNIVRFLISNGVPSSKLKAVGYADTIPKVSNTNERNRAINRRIEIVFLLSS